MLILQGWKLKVSALSAVFLMAGGAVMSFWANQTPLSVYTTTQKTAPLTDIKTVLAVVTSKASTQTTAPAQSQGRVTNEVQVIQGATSPVINETIAKPSTPTTVSDKTPTPMPPLAPVSSPVVLPDPVETPLTSNPPYTPPKSCSVCGQVGGVKGSMCPMLHGDTMSAYFCRLDPTQ